MGIQTILGQKIDQTQKFLEDGTRIPVTLLWVAENVVVSHKTIDKNNYSAIQLGFGQKKKANKSQMGQTKGANLKIAPKILKEVKMDGDLPSVGQVINAAEVFNPGDIINVTGVSKGKGYAGVVKRHHFKGGPRTHGQSDRERAPGSIGQTTTPGRVYKGKRMAGRMGHETATIRNLEVIDVLKDTILVKGLVPGGRNTLIMLKKVGENKKFVPLYREKEEVESTKRSVHTEEAAEPISESSSSPASQNVEDIQTENEDKEEVKENAN
jgi:large subunit ribosomal protein L3